MAATYVAVGVGQLPIQVGRQLTAIALGKAGKAKGSS